MKPEAFFVLKSLGCCCFSLACFKCGGHSCSFQSYNECLWLSGREEDGNGWGRFRLQADSD